MSNITRERLEARLADLKTQREQVRQQFIAIEGAIANTDFWLAEIDKPDSALVEVIESAS